MHINAHFSHVTDVLNGLILFTDNLIISGCHKNNEKCSVQLTKCSFKVVESDL